MNWVEQVDKSGCGFACLAMLLDTTYARIREQTPKLCNCGLEDEELDQFLAENGFAVQRKWEYVDHNGATHEKWPPKPWADKHLVLVTQTKRDVDQHYVVMDAKGVVYDPADSEFKKCRLTRYHEVVWVAAIHSV